MPWDFWRDGPCECIIKHVPKYSPLESDPDWKRHTTTRNLPLHKRKEQRFYVYISTMVSALIDHVNAHNCKEHWDFGFLEYQ